VKPEARVQNTERPERTGFVWAGLVLFLVAAAALSLGVGPRHLGGDALRVALELRGIRLLLGVLAGGVLALVGASQQGLLRNPLVDPFTLGVASGAALGASIVMALGGASSLGLPLGGLAGALLITLLVYLLARVRGRISATSLVLAGVIVSFLFSSLVMLVMILGHRTLGEAVYMMMGSLGAVFTRRSIWLLLGSGIVALAGCAWLIAQARALDVLATGEETAATLGVDTQRTTRTVFLVSSVLVGLVVSFTGAVSFVGLVVPHLVRLGLGPGHRSLLPASFLGGAGLLLVSDVVARSIVPGGLPLSVVTALIGVPFFIYLLRWRLQ
jgi:iron complex transport system permease protein